jgi:O-antigen/teichoic acid export membrane protein
MTRSAWIATFGTTGLTMVLTLGSSILIARGLGPEGRGLLLALTVWPAILGGMFTLSVNEATSYYVARASTAGADLVSAGYSGAGFVLQCLIGLTATLLTVCAMQVLPIEEERAHLPAVLAYAAAFTPIMIMDLHFKAVLQGRGKYRALSITRLGQPLVYVLCVAALMLANALTVENVMITMVASSAVSLLVGAAFAGVGRLSAISVDLMREMIATGWKFHVGNLLLASGAWVERILVVRFNDDASAGYYAVAVAVGSLGTGLVVQSLVISLTRYMPAATSNDHKAELLKHHFDIAAILVVAINGSAALLAPWWVPRIFGTAFAPAVFVVLIFLLTGTILALRQVIDRAMRFAHVVKVGVAGEAVALAALLPCALAGSRLAGFDGFAIGLALAQSCALMVVVIMTARILLMRPLDFIPLSPASLTRLAKLLGNELRSARNAARK